MFVPQEAIFQAMDGLVPAAGQGDGAREGAGAGVWQGRASGGVGSVGCGDQEALRGGGGQPHLDPPAHRPEFLQD